MSRSGFIINPYRSAIVDVSSLLAYGGPGRSDLPTAKLTKKAIEYLLDESVSETSARVAQFRFALEFLARQVVFDYLVVDEFAFNKNAQLIDENLFLALQPYCFPESDYEAAAKLVDDLGLYWPEDSKPEIGGEAEKLHWIDALADRLPAIMAIANTGQQPSRAAFYLAIAGKYSAPIVLHPSKDAVLRQLRSRIYLKIGEKVRTDILNLIARKQVDDSAADRLIGDEGMAHLSFPSISKYILMSALQRGCSILDVARELHASEYGRAFRGWVADICKHVSEGDMNEREYDKQMKEVSRLTDTWRKETDAAIEVFFKRRGIPLRAVILFMLEAGQLAASHYLKVPRLDWLSELTRCVSEKLSFNDPILNPKYHLAYMSKLTVGL